MKEIIADKLRKNASKITVWRIGDNCYQSHANFARKFHSFIRRYFYLLSEPGLKHRYTVCAPSNMRADAFAVKSAFWKKKIKIGMFSSMLSIVRASCRVDLKSKSHVEKWDVDRS